MNFSNLVKETLQKVRESLPILEAGYSVHVDMQRKGFDKALQASTVSLVHAFNENKSALLQSATVDFLRSEEERLWEIRQELCALQSQREKEANRLAREGFVSKSNEYEAVTRKTLGAQIFIINEKIKGIRVALDHAIHAGADVCSERCLQSVNQRKCYLPSVYGDSYGMGVVNYIQPTKQ